MLFIEGKRYNLTCDGNTVLLVLWYGPICGRRLHEHKHTCHTFLKANVRLTFRCSALGLAVAGALERF